jgi:hypothetical protein
MKTIQTSPCEFKIPIYVIVKYNINLYLLVCMKLSTLAFIEKVNKNISYINMQIPIQYI